MRDILGYRGKWGVIIPSTNTVVEPDFYAMAPEGITLHTGRIFITDPDVPDDSSFEALMVQIREMIGRAVEDVKSCLPDYLIMGMSSETFWGGKEGNRQFQQRLESQAGVRIATGADACHKALTLLGAKRVGVITPYQPVGDAEVRRYFVDSGYDVVKLKGLKCASVLDIALLDEATLRSAVAEVDGADVDAIVQVGTNLSMIRLADQLETELGKPVIAINAAIFWHALRENGINDQMTGFGPLLRDF